MQTIIQVISKGTKSLRDQIVRDEKHLEKFGIVVSEKKRNGRPNGWAKLHKFPDPGAMNLQWHSASQTLICRIVTKRDIPHKLAGAFTEYLLSRPKLKIHSIQIIPA